MAANLSQTRFLLLLRSNRLSWSGAVLTTLSFLGMLTTFTLLSAGAWTGPYVGLMTFLVLPGLFVLGLLVIPVGLLLFRKQTGERMRLLADKPIRLVRTIAVLTLVNLAVVGLMGYQGVHYMDSNEFCGTLCHEVMFPTYQAYLASNHARVDCVECHIGEGASWFARSKISGVRQVFAVLRNSFSRPIPVPIENLRPARETCEQCHWPDKFTGDRLVVRQHFAEDREVSGLSDVLILKTGGTRPDGTASGIHWHIHSGVKVTFVASDPQRMKIPWVKLEDGAGQARVFAAPGIDPAEPPPGEIRTMDCVDCHNQPSHVFHAASDSLDEALAADLVPRLPFIKKIGLQALREPWSREGAEAGIRRTLEGFYAGELALEPADRPRLDQAASALTAIWRRNVFPSMAVTWGTYRSMAGHLGCQRCHDDNHEDQEGETISMECGLCHVLLAEKEKNPPILKALGLQPGKD